MAKKSKLIPFSWLPAAWGLSGKTREIAELEYYYDGFDLEERLAALEEDKQKRDLKFLEIDRKYGRISQEEYTRSYAKHTLSGKELELKLADLDLKEDKITRREYEKKVATIKGEPWVTVINLEPGLKGIPGQIELDWNDCFIEHLKDEGYKGTDDEDIANSWLTNLCKTIAIEEFGGVGEFDEQLAEAEYNRGKDLGGDFREVR